MTEHNKLVRDNIPAICEANGEIPEIRILNDDTEYPAALYDKLDEEALEVRKAAPDKRLGELADALEVIRAITKACGFTAEQLEEERMRKFGVCGGFDDRIFLIRTSTA